MTDHSTPTPDTFADLVAISGDEVVSHSFVRDIPLRDDRVLALVTLDNGRDHTRPNTLGPRTLLEYAATLGTLRERAKAGEIHGVAVTGKPYILAAGADLSRIDAITDPALALLLGQLGHYALGSLAEVGVPSFAFINGLALGGGLEIALHADYRTVSSAAQGIGLSEVFLGLVPGWGGAYLTPQIIGIERALTLVLENPLKQNRVLNGPAAHKLGLADTLIPSARFLEDSITWAGEVIAGRLTVRRPHKPGRVERLLRWEAAVNIATKRVRRAIGTAPQAPYAALELLRAAKRSNRAQAFARENAALAKLIGGDQFRASLYAFNLVQKRAKKAVGAPDASLAKPVTMVGVLGAGYMARQLALLFLRQLKVPVLITDVDAAKVADAIAYIRMAISTLLTKERITADDADRLNGLIHGTDSLADFALCDWVIEAVFEDLTVKQNLFANLEPHLDPTAVLATNTSSLLVSDIGAKLQHPERLVGFHFFTPVALMPLVEVVATAVCDEASLATAFVVARKLEKNAVRTADTTGFAVNRLLAVLLGESLRAVDGGSTFAQVDQALAPLGLPMPPSALLDLIGLRVGAHVLDIHHAAFGDRFYTSDTLHRLADHGLLLDKNERGDIVGFNPWGVRIATQALEQRGDVGVRGRSRGKNRPQLTGTLGSAPGILTSLQDALAREVKTMLEEGVVAAAEDIDLCLVLGAGFPFHLGGITPYLDRVGASERVFGDTFHHPPVHGIA